MSSTNPKSAATALDAVVVGAGFAGIYMLHKLRQLGLAARVLEAGGGAGGTWFWNRYPGARCDVESMQYCYQFDAGLEQQWTWRERYAAQPEILSYLEHVLDRFDLRAHIQFNTRVASAIFNAKDSPWDLTTEAGERHRARFVVLATGCLSTANDPAIPGRDRFRGPIYHTGRWPHAGVDFSGQRVAVIGTGSSAIQAIPEIAKQAAHLTVFQRTPNYSVPAHNEPLAAEEIARVRANYPEIRAQAKAQPFAFDLDFNPRAAADMTAEEIRAELDKRWRMGGLNFYGTFADLLISPEANRIAADFVRAKIAAQVQDPGVAALLTPTNVFGCKRLCADTGYFETFNRANVELVDISTTPIETITADGLRVGERSFSFDAIVFATGFDAMTGAITRIDIRGRNGLALRDKWSAGPRNYLGLAAAGFPNLFTISGPGSPSVLTNMVTSIEQHVEYVGGIIDHLRRHQLATIEAEPAAEDAWVRHVNDIASQTLLQSCNSWYLGANVPGKPRVFMPYIGFPAYVDKCNEVAAKGYEGFRLA